MRSLQMIGCSVVMLAASSAAHAAGCQTFVGNWYWFTGYIVTLKADHTIVYGGKPVGKWSCTSPTKPSATLRWDSKFVDTITIKDGGIVGTNQVGYKIWANRSKPETAADYPANNPNVRPRPRPGPAPPTPQPSGGCQGGNWRQQCEAQLKNDPIQGPFPSQGAINNCVQQKMAACGNLVP